MKSYFQHLLDGITNVIKQDKQRTQQKFSSHDKQIREVVRAVGLIANNTRRYQTQVTDKLKLRVLTSTNFRRCNTCFSYSKIP